MPEAVVYLLEVVEVYEQQGNRAVRPLRAGKHPLGPVEHKGAVWQPRERVVESLVAKLLLEVPAFGDVGDRPDEARRR
jgi:hypothetical protein